MLYTISFIFVSPIALDTLLIGLKGVASELRDGFVLQHSVNIGYPVELPATSIQFRALWKDIKRTLKVD